VRLLLDTHAFLWAATQPEELDERARTAIEDTANEILISAAVAWEISIKVSLGKLAVPGDPAVWLPARVHSLGFQELDIQARHALAVMALPDIHRDPFDRMMIAQAQLEGLTFVTRDPNNQKYPVNVMRA
jgi:PIN domain nuclease of toxin-antitoxin system